MDSHFFNEEMKVNDMKDQIIDGDDLYAQGKENIRDQLVFQTLFHFKKYSE